MTNTINIFDGGYGSLFIEHGMKMGENSSVFGLENPDIIKDIHKQYLEAGAKYITSNTFSANIINIESEDLLTETIKTNLESAQIYKSQFDYKVALDIGPLGQILKPIGPLHPSVAYNHFKQIIEIANNNYDIIIIETMTDILEAKMAVLAAKENSSKPIFVTFSIDQDGKTVNGNDLLSIVSVFEGLGVDCIGLNCGLGPKEMIPHIKDLVKMTNLPILIQANAGLPIIDKFGNTVYPLNIEDFSKYYNEIVKLGIDYIGGCCGTNPSYINKISNLKHNIRKKIKEKRVVTSGRKCIELGKNFLKVGESINPSSSKDLKNDLINGSFSTLKQLAISQKDADILDINLSVGELRDIEPKLFEDAVIELSSINNTALQFDSSNPLSIEKACRYYCGVPIINSSELTKKSYPKIFEIAKKYGGYIILLPINEDGIPSTTNEKIDILIELISIAKNDYNISKDKLIFDPLVFSLATNKAAIQDVIDGIIEAKKLEVLTSIGLSNISFGMPNRKIINDELLQKSQSVGLDLAIMSVFKPKKNEDYKKGEVQTQINSLYDAVVNGMSEIAITKVNELLETKEALDIINNDLIPALDKVGQLFEDKKMYLPQLLSASETAIKVNLILSKHFTLSQNDNKKSLNILLATVKNDIHDIGKNIVGLILKANGHNIIDLGKDVDPKAIIESLENNEIDIIALSALMTTTIVSMEDSIKLVKNSKYSNIPIFVGGAALSSKIAEQIGADYYSSSPIEMLKILKTMYN